MGDESGDDVSESAAGRFPGDPMEKPFICPVCAKPLQREENSFVCENRHCFDVAKEGYVNLLRSGKSGESTGDNRAMASARRAFLSKGYFDPLAVALCDTAAFCPAGGAALDICCGEGYYSAFLKKKRPDLQVLGFDLSKEMVRLAAKRKAGVSYFVANLARIPLADGSADFAFQFFSPFSAPEFCRVLAPGGVLVSAAAGERHLWQMKEILYETPYPNTVAPPPAPGFRLKETRQVNARILLNDPADIEALFRMTPYAYHTPRAGIERLLSLNTLETELSFVLFIFQKQ